MLLLVWQSSIYELWKERNQCVHSNARLSPPHVFNIIDHAIRNNLFRTRLLHSDNPIRLWLLNYFNSGLMLLNRNHKMHNHPHHKFDLYLGSRYISSNYSQILFHKIHLVSWFINIYSFFYSIENRHKSK